MWRTLWIGLFLTLLVGCATGPLLDNPNMVTGPDGPEDCNNPLLVTWEFKRYPVLFDNVLQVLNDTNFRVREANMYDGRIETFPRTAPGVGLPFKPGSPDLAERVLATFQSYRHRASIRIIPTENRDFFIHVTVLKELEDLPRPVRATAGGAVFLEDSNNVARQFELVDPTQFESNWIPKGRDIYLEQEIISRLREKM
ncbi:MAG: hypothetical protein ACFCD0_02940 [Gemmataceae bacterium]